MSSPARDARLLAASKGFTQVIGRGSAHIVTRNPTTGKCAYDGQVGGGWHYGAGLETDTAWVAGVAPWKYQIVKANYNLFALSNLSNGQILKWLDPASGQSITFQPMALQWTNSLNQIQQISMPQSVAAQVNDDILYWPAGYGAGLHFKYIASPSRLNKLLIIDSAASLPATGYDTLELNFIMQMSAGVTAYIDSGSGLAAWDKKTTIDTVKAIEFRLSGGSIVWSFAVPIARDSARNETIGSMRLKKSGSSLYVSCRFPKSWIDSAVFPIMLDPTVDYQVGASANDGFYDIDYSYFYSADELRYGSASANFRYVGFARFTGVTIPVGATITTANLQFLIYSAYGSHPLLDIYFEDAANPGAITDAADGEGCTRTTATVQSTPNTTSGWWTTSDISSIIQELVNSYSFASGAAMQAIVRPPAISGSNQYGKARAYDYTGNVSGPKLHIEYTEEAAVGTWAGTWGG